jgi:hypothetical protein
MARGSVRPVVDPPEEGSTLAEIDVERSRIPRETCARYLDNTSQQAGHVKVAVRTSANAGRSARQPNMSKTNPTMQASPLGATKGDAVFGGISTWVRSLDEAFPHPERSSTYEGGGSGWQPLELVRLGRRRIALAVEIQRAARYRRFAFATARRPSAMTRSLASGPLEAQPSLALGTAAHRSRAVPVDARSRPRCALENAPTCGEGKPAG